MTESQLRAFNLLFFMLRCVLMNMGYNEKDGFIALCDEQHKAILDRLVE